VTDARAKRAIEAVWRIESARLIAGLARMVRDVGLAEDLAQDALVAALERWPQSGVPDNPGAWLMATAKNRAIDLARRHTTFERKQEELARDVGMRMALERSDFEAAVGDEVGDDLLGLIFTCCHPLLSREARVALTLRLLGGLSTPEIARAFLVKESTIAQRLVRAKRTLRDANVPFEVPRGEELDARLPSVLEVIYLVFNEGYAASAGEDWIRPALCEEALRLGRILAALAPAEPEAHGLIALLEIQASRNRARLGPDGAPVLLLDQDRARWDLLLIGRGLKALERAERSRGPLGPYGLQAAIAACHTRARSVEETDRVQTAAPRPPLPLCAAPPPPPTPARAAPRRPTGCGSPPSTTPSPSLPPRRSSSSTAPSPSAWPSAPRPASNCSTRSPPSPPCGSTTSSPASAATCSPSSAAMPRPPPSSPALRR
jgi:RNA polymerase sigma factor (sigma-70 family)